MLSLNSGSIDVLRMSLELRIIWTLGHPETGYHRRSVNVLIYIKSVLQTETTYFSSSDWSMLDFLLTETCDFDTKTIAFK